MSGTIGWDDTGEAITSHSIGTCATIKAIIGGLVIDTSHTWIARVRAATINIHTCFANQLRASWTQDAHITTIRGRGRVDTDVIHRARVIITGFNGMTGHRSGACASVAQTIGGDGVGVAASEADRTRIGCAIDDGVASLAIAIGATRAWTTHIAIQRCL